MPPEITEDARQPSAPPDKIDVTADDAEQMTVTRAKSKGTHENSAASDMEEIVDFEVGDDQVSFAK